MNTVVVFSGNVAFEKNATARSIPASPLESGDIAIDGNILVTGDLGHKDHFIKNNLPIAFTFGRIYVSGDIICKLSK